MIAESQLKSLLGLECLASPAGCGGKPKAHVGAAMPTVAGSDIFSDVYVILSNIEYAHWQTCVLSLVCIVVLLAAGHKRVPKWMPTILLLMIACTLVSFLADFTKYGINVVGEVPVSSVLATFMCESCGFSNIEWITKAQVTVLVVGPHLCDAAWLCRRRICWVRV